MDQPATWTEDPDFVEVYDVENAGRWDHDFYLDLAEQLGARRVVDVGCGTGVLTVDLAARGVQVTGVDPAGAMLDVARARPAAESVTWVHGTAADLPAQTFDYAVMEGHVAQYFLHRCEWDDALTHTHRALVPGGYLAFESRNPLSLEWDDWTEENTRATQDHPGGGEFTSWIELVSVRDGEHDETLPGQAHPHAAGDLTPAETTHDDGPLITHRGHAILPDGRHTIAEETLRFRPLPVLWESLEAAGFEVVELWGDWDRSDWDPDSPEIILLARRAA
ncbi:MAG TPA: methyltransferase domain-containing protein [Candidatus Nesterenkonia stercoripullorum]|uniref:Methyltransferase domain-containing protein n=1 Tax=Candidatus Nesterenkonia stercoripullorum TaxID=2838701 RepID=A0A9D2A6R5_9MICC|nr:methyltransferase domain-containing protein [Candidatus Nesterenkonia stercoripullorum]